MLVFICLPPSPPLSPPLSLLFLFFFSSRDFRCVAVFVSVFVRLSVAISSVAPSIKGEMNERLLETHWGQVDVKNPQAPLIQRPGTEQNTGATSIAV